MPVEYYCEYLYNAIGWRLLNSHVKPMYYCPSLPISPPPNPQANSLYILEPVYNGPQSFPDQPYFVDYEYANGKFTVVEANVPQGYHAPADPLAFAKKTGRLRIFPVSMSPGEQPRSAEENEGGNADKYLA